MSRFDEPLDAGNASCPSLNLNDRLGLLALNSTRTLTTSHEPSAGLTKRHVFFDGAVTTPVSKYQSTTSDPRGVWLVPLAGPPGCSSRPASGSEKPLLYEGAMPHRGTIQQVLREPLQRSVARLCGCVMKNLVSG